MSVYIIRCGEYVKIGIAQHALSRMQALQIGNPYRLELLADMPGGALFEMELHNRFIEYRVSGEWFHCSGAVAEFVEWAIAEHSPKRVVPPRIFRYIKRNLPDKKDMPTRRKSIDANDYAVIIDRAIKAAYGRMPNRVKLKSGLVNGKRSLSITLTGFEVKNGAVIDLLNTGKPEVKDGGK